MRWLLLLSSPPRRMNWFEKLTCLRFKRLLRSSSGVVSSLAMWGWWGGGVCRPLSKVGSEPVRLDQLMGLRCCASLLYQQRKQQTSFMSSVAQSSFSFFISSGIHHLPCPCCPDFLWLLLLWDQKQNPICILKKFPFTQYPLVPTPLGESIPRVDKFPRYLVW